MYGNRRLAIDIGLHVSRLHRLHTNYKLTSCDHPSDNLLLFSKYICHGKPKKCIKTKDPPGGTSGGQSWN